MEQLGFWELIHGTSAGCASIVAFESMREFMHGPALLGIYAVVTFGLFHVQQKHLAHVRRKANRHEIPDYTHLAELTDE